MSGSQPTWSEIAPWYDALIEAGSGPHETAVECLLRLVPPLAGATVVDLACGQGLATRALAGAGAARVIGVDSSGEMVRLARERTARTDVRYVEDDAQRLASFPDAWADGVTCQLALMDIPDLDATLAAAHRVLRPGGWFAFVIGHPCFLAPDARPALLDDGRPAVTVTGYFDERFWRSANPQGVRRAGNHHRMLATYLNALSAEGFVLERVDEPRPSAQLAAERPLYTQVPIFFAGLARASSGHRGPPSPAA